MNSTPLTPDAFNRFGAAVTARLDEMADGFAVVGFHPISGEPFIFRKSSDTRTHLALNALLLAAINVPAIQHPTADGETQG